MLCGLVPLVLAGVFGGADTASILRRVIRGQGGDPPCTNALDVIAGPARLEDSSGTRAFDRGVAIVEDEFDRLIFARQSSGASDPWSIHVSLQMQRARSDRNENRSRRTRSRILGTSEAAPCDREHTGICERGERVAAIWELNGSFIGFPLCVCHLGVAPPT